MSESMEAEFEGERKRTADRREQLERLVIQAQRGDRASLEELFTEYVLSMVQNGLQWFLRGSARRRIGLADASQEVVIRLLRGLPKHEYEGSSSFGGWVLAVTGNTVQYLIERMQAQKRNGRLLDENEADLDEVMDPVQSEAVVDDRDEVQQLERAIAKLPPLQIAVIERAIFRGLQQADVAAELRISQSTVSRTLNAAIEHLRWTATQVRRKA